MPGLIFYATRADSESLRQWINEEKDIAWIVKTREQDNTYEWKAVERLDSLAEQCYALWHVGSGPLNVPSGKTDVPDSIVADPFQGWRQTLGYPNGTEPWFGGNLPGPYSLTFAEHGCEAPDSLARSEFSWLGDRYKSIGKPAHPLALKWWQRLTRFIERSTTKIPWAETANRLRSLPAYVFPDAAIQLREGRHRDINPWRPGK